MITSSDSYDAVAKTLHWLIALLILGMLVLGFVMAILDGPTKSAVLQVHKSIGMTILILGLCRLVWRWLNPPPPLPENMPRWEKIASHITHITLYVLILVMPFVGWMIISTFTHSSSYFGLFPIPNLPVLHDLPNRKEIREILYNIHSLLAWIIIIVASGHAGAALKHHFIDRDTILLRMSPKLFTRLLCSLRGGN